MLEKTVTGLKVYLTEQDGKASVSKMAGWLAAKVSFHHRCITVTLPLHCRYIAVTLPSHCRYIAVTLPLDQGGCQGDQERRV